MRKITMKKINFALLAAICIGGNLTGNLACSKKGPGEKVGEKLDHTGDKIHDAVTPDGPAEKAGKKLDKVFNDANGLGKDAHDLGK